MHLVQKLFLYVSRTEVFGGINDYHIVKMIHYVEFHQGVSPPGPPIRRRGDDGLSLGRVSYGCVIFGHTPVGNTACAVCAGWRGHPTSVPIADPAW